MSSFGAAVSLAGMAGLASMVPEEPWEPFSGVNHISNFARSGVVAVSELMGHGAASVSVTMAKAPRRPHRALA